MNNPELWFKRTHVESGRVFEDLITRFNCPSRDVTPFGQLNTRAQSRIAELNTKMPGVWLYELIGWRIGYSVEQHFGVEE